jgi:hypothetical protein
LTSIAVSASASSTTSRPPAIGISCASARGQVVLHAQRLEGPRQKERAAGNQAAQLRRGAGIAGDRRFRTEQRDLAQHGIGRRGQAHRRASRPALLDPAPLLLQRAPGRREAIGLRPGRRPHQHARHRRRAHDALHRGLQRRALAAGQRARHGDARLGRRQGQQPVIDHEAARHLRALAGERVLGHLHAQRLAFHRRRASQRQERRALQAEIEKRADARLDAQHARGPDGADQGSGAAALQDHVEGAVLLAERGPQLPGIALDDEFPAAHRYPSPVSSAWVSASARPTMLE